jgi:adenylosuccinate lyase
LGATKCNLCWDDATEILEYKDLVSKDCDVSAHLTIEEIEKAFDGKHYLRNVGKVFERAFS